MSEDDYMKIINYIVSKDGQKAIRHNGRVYIVPMNFNVNDLFLRAHRSGLSAKKYFEDVHYYVLKIVMLMTYYGNCLQKSCSSKQT